MNEGPTATNDKPDGRALMHPDDISLRFAAGSPHGYMVIRVCGLLQLYDGDSADWPSSPGVRQAMAR